MANVQTSDKWVAAHAFINTWLKDPTLYCNNCGQDYLQCCEAPRPVLLKRAKIEDDKETEQDIFLHCNHCEKDMFLCCENPQIGNNKDHTYALVKQNKELSKESMNEYASNKTKTMRMGISIPPRLFRDLGNYFMKMYDEKLFDTQEELRKFMKEFPAFAIPERI